MREISFNNLLTITNRFNASRDQGDDVMNLTEMAVILGAECTHVDISRYGDCIDGSGCADCGESVCQVYL